MLEPRGAMVGVTQVQVAEDENCVCFYPGV